MEEAKPPPSAPQAPSVPAPAAAEVPEGRSKKRKLDAAEFWESDYYKLRLAVKNLRPLFVEVIPGLASCFVSKYLGFCADH
ncbi:hypothetical protein BHE74_00028474 [Ensete ventricosum]|uniref:Uncharacterized protein n=1 Tax=Ensete ventricosum TaxID=4639 RepID=A0A444GEQ2_ENSVE|nr:hypothetical protein B296_00016457 [Ensete ventricosum]RWW33360.1 hypothetical protein GW17_00001939 [Ensete ventricosum]RWW64299.1 hypothetical protein BHE74_00028474 [Ensete ventricosum]RZR71875.1 hypothetical protein BHM03_00008262 [Ensete ventricosum]